MVKVFIKTESHFPIGRKKIVEALKDAIGKKVYRDAEVSITIVGDRRMRTLNKNYRQLDKTTDVLSFPQNDPSQPSPMPFVEAPDDVLRLGDIVVSFPQARIMAGKYNKLIDDIVIELALHGLNHLFGIHHD